MTRGSTISATEVADASAEVVARLFAPWVGVLWLTALPLRLLQVHFAARLGQMGDTAGQYGDYLGSLALMVSGALVVSLLGRAVFVRAAEQALLLGEVPPGRAWRLPPAATASYVAAALVLEAAFYATLLMVAASPLLLLLAGLAAATHGAVERPSPLATLGAAVRALRHGRTLAALMAVYAIALLAALVNLYFLFQLGLWMAGAIPGLDPGTWEPRLSLHSARFRWTLLMGALLAVEPFWLAALTVYVQRARSRTTGEDLRQRWAQLTTSAVVLALALLAAPAQAQEPALTTVDYAHALHDLRTALDQGRLDEARPRAEALLHARVLEGGVGVTVEPDPSVLGPAARVRDPGQARLLARRIAAVEDALGRHEVAGAPPIADPERLRRLEAEQEELLPERGGTVGPGIVGRLSPGQRISDAFEKAMDVLVAWVRKLVEWLRRLWPARTEGEGGDGRVSVVTVAIVAVVAAVLALLGWRALGRRDQALALGDAAVTDSHRRDEDPLSREAAEWERYAGELAARGLLREAMRAWYHAVLVTLFRRGLLHYQRGRTNWEYAAELGPEHPWRAGFVSLTRGFDRAWYGHLASTAEALGDYAGQARAVLSAVHEREAEA